MIRRGPMHRTSILICLLVVHVGIQHCGARTLNAYDSFQSRLVGTFPHHAPLSQHMNSNDFPKEDFSLENDLKHHRSRRLTGRGPALSTTDCDSVTAVPDTVRDEMGLDTFYKKYTHAYGIPIISSDLPPDDAIKRGCYTVKFLLADRLDLRDAMHDGYGRVGIIGQVERTTDIPEHSYIPDEWNERARGFGGTPNIPISTAAEENILCYGRKQDLWYEEDILVHEFSHGIHLISVNQADPSWEERLTSAHENAKTKGLWQNTYAISNTLEYFAEGVQSYFDVEVHRTFVDYIHNNISTREDLLVYDPELFEVIREVFPCENKIVDRCQNQSSVGLQRMRLNCAFDIPRPTPGIITTRPTTLSTVDELASTTSQPFTRAETTRQPFTRAPATSQPFTQPPTSAVTQPHLVTEARQTMSTDKGCEDAAPFCEQYASLNECTYNDVIQSMCKRSCRACAGCIDYMELCAELANRDFCILKEDYMTMHCGRSCEKC